MRRLFLYVGRLYLQYLFIILFALAFLFAGLDYIQQASELDGFNIKTLYFFYRALYAVDLLFPISLVFAMIVTKVVLIRSNALMSFYALGYSKRQVLTPIVTLGLFTTLLYVALHATSFVEADRQAKALLHGKRGGDVKRDLFVKYDESFIYMGRLVPEKKLAEEIRIFRT
jgi:lipopolysaccharide export system permease protein